MDFSGKELESLEWFMVRSAAKLSGDFPSQPWTTLLMQVSMTDPAVRHALLALSSAHKEEVQGLGHMGNESKHEQTLFTMSQYDKAIKSLKPHLSASDKTSTHIACISSVLFVATDFLRGHYSSGLVHLKHGLNLFLENRASIKEQGSYSDYIDGWLIMMFTRLLVQAKLTTQFFGFPCWQLLRLGYQKGHYIFESVLQARRSLDHIMLRVMSLQEQSYQSLTGKSGESRTALFDAQNGLQTELYLWLQTCDATVSKLPPNSQICERSAYQILKLYHHLAVVLTGTGIEMWDSQRFDRYDPIFLDMINICTDLHRCFFSNGKPNNRVSPDPEPSSPNSIIEMGWIAPLCFATVECRNPYIRRQAIRLLKASPHKEGIWNAEMTLAMVKHIVKAEENGFYAPLNIRDGHHDKIEPLSDEVLDAPPLPQEMRFRNFSVELPEDKVGKLILNFDRCDSQGNLQRFGEEYDLRTGKWSCRSPSKQSGLSPNRWAP